jgi:hypothetical protein
VGGSGLATGWKRGSQGEEERRRVVGDPAAKTAQTVLEHSDLEGHEKTDGEAGEPQIADDLLLLSSSPCATIAHRSS